MVQCGRVKNNISRKGSEVSALKTYRGIGIIIIVWVVFESDEDYQIGFSVGGCVGAGHSDEICSSAPLTVNGMFY